MVTMKNQDAAVLVVNNIVAPLLENAASFDLAMVTGKYNAKARTTLKSILRVLQRLASGIAFDSTSSAYKIANQWIDERHEAFRTAIDQWARDPSLTPLDEEFIAPSKEAEIDAISRLYDIIKVRDKEVRKCIASNTMQVVCIITIEPEA
jgi:hypothetical protein